MLAISGLYGSGSYWQTQAGSNTAVATNLTGSGTTTVDATTVAACPSYQKSAVLCGVLVNVAAAVTGSVQQHDGSSGTTLITFSCSATGFTGFGPEGILVPAVATKCLALQVGAGATAVLIYKLV